MFHFSLISENRTAQFAARFEMQVDNSVVYYHPDRTKGGLPCTLAEAEQLIQAYASTCTRSMQWMLYWAIASGIMSGILEVSKILVMAQWLQFLIILAPFPLIVYLWYQAGQKPLQLLGTRLYCSPPRSVESAFWHRVNALPASLFITMLFPSAGLVYHTIQDGWEHLNTSYLVVVGSSLFMTAVWIYARTGRWR